MDRLCRPLNFNVSLHNVTYAKAQAKNAASVGPACAGSYALCSVGTSALCAFEVRGACRFQHQALPAQVSSFNLLIENKSNISNMQTIIKCIKCNQKLRVPTDKGTVELTCPMCKTTWRWSDDLSQVSIEEPNSKNETKPPLTKENTEQTADVSPKIFIEKNKFLIHGGFGILLMFIFSKMLVAKPQSIGFFDGILFSWAYSSSINSRIEFSYYLLLLFLALISSFFIFEKNRNKIFYCIIVITLMKWIVDIFIISNMTDGKYEIKLWAIFAFFIGTYLTYSNLLSNTPSIENNRNITS